MLKDISSSDGIYLACGATDLRSSVNGLAIIIKHDFKMDVFGNFLFLFCNRKRNRLKGLSWDSNGFVLYYKRLDGEGARLSGLRILRMSETSPLSNSSSLWTDFLLILLKDLVR
ncbi:IS66 family insertion sequence element accessory protein TnpB [Desulfosporosinus sp.]|uniref:IS66 family insertion sequence element accessory protein TnpB n=1 Tax=Desulfosporosinus sp. TaxID=157907 RepID=UPI00345BDE4C|nr:IS66 family insertion sequence element accessory protein TnpB [Desulfosporosinus sp.]MBC2726355.1 IS66 family insertion sequence element accessory protein TnpB [Desulfosporosinus sp.]